MHTTILNLDTFSYGVLFSLAIVIFLTLRLFTEDPIPTNQRAKRLALISGLLVILLMVASNFLIYTYLSGEVASFIAFPMLCGGCILMLLGIPRLYRKLGGRPSIDQIEGPIIGVENEARLQQAKLWRQLQSMHHFREMLNGDLVSLVTGDRIYWTTCAGKPCLSIELANSNSLLVSRVETLVKYVEVQGNIAKLLLNVSKVNQHENDVSNQV